MGKIIIKKRATKCRGDGSTFKASRVKDCKRPVGEKWSIKRLSKQALNIWQVVS